MAGLKQLSAGSSQIIMMMFRDKNNAPIKADEVKDPENYTIQIDVKTNAIKVVKK